MPSASRYYLSPAGRRPMSPIAAALLTLLAAVAVLASPAGFERASIWAILLALSPASAPSAFALACASTTGCIAGLVAEAAGRRSALRPALTVIIVAALLSPAALAVPLWPALLAAAALIAVPVPRRSSAANDNAIPTHRMPRPFSLAA